MQHAFLQLEWCGLPPPQNASVMFATQQLNLDTLASTVTTHSMSEGKISFSFGGKAGPSKAAPPGAGAGPSNLELLMAKAKGKPPAQKPALLFDDGEEEQQRPPPDVLKPKAARKQAETAPRVNLMSRAERRAHDEALKIDQSVFDYDGVYDDLKAAEREVEAARSAAKADKTPKYAEAFRAAAQTRKLDRLRAEEKMLEREREKEGDEFADKEKFVTEAYKRQMEEVRAAEQAEKEREDALRKSNKGPGLTSLYASMLDDNAAKHAAAMAATAKKDPGPSLAVRPPPAQAFQDEEEYDPLLAAEARRSSAGGDAPPAGARMPGSRTINADTGKEIEVNDDGEIVDKRSLLKAGLNITKKPQPELPPSLLAGRRSAASETAEAKPYVSRAVGSAASYAERMARERKRLAEQIRAEEDKKRAAAEQRAAEEEEAARRRREGDDGIAAKRRSEAKERYLARKRARDEAEAARKRQKEE